MNLRILIDGRERYCAPFYANQMDGATQAIRDHMEALREGGRVVAIVEDGNVSHLIASSPFEKPSGSEAA